MRITFVRRICQTFFFLLFLWFCITASVGASWWQLRGWPVNWFLQLDPLVSLGTLLTTHTIYRGLLWGLATVMLTLVLGRFFCGWICPLGSLQHLVGFWAGRKKSTAAKITANRYLKWQSIKYGLLVFLLASGIFDLAFGLIQWPLRSSTRLRLILIAVLILLILLTLRPVSKAPRWRLFWLLALIGLGFFAGAILKERRIPAVSLQIGLLDPLPLLYRSVNLIILPFVGGSEVKIAVSPRFYQGAGLIGAIFFFHPAAELENPPFLLPLYLSTGCVVRGFEPLCRLAGR